MAETFSRLFPEKYLESFLKHNTRFDGRAASEYREIKITHNPLPACDGSSLVMIGNSSAICGITLEVGVPPLEEPTHGRIRLGMNIPPSAGDEVSGAHRMKWDEESRYLIELFNQLLSKRPLVDLSQLKITEGKACWVVYADITIINHDGNLFDLCLFALQSALQSTMIPSVVVEDGVEVKIIDDLTMTTPLCLQHVFYPCSFGQINDLLIVDPTIEESSYVTSQLHIVYDDAMTICGMFKPGGSLIGLKQMQSSLTIAATHAGAQAATITPANIIKRNKAGDENIGDVKMGDDQ